MVYCRIDELPEYKSCSQNFVVAIEYILSHDLSTLPFGKTVIDGDNAYIIKSIIETKEDNSIPYEGHRKYIDVHIDLEGDEIIYFSNDRKKVIKEYGEADDYELLDCNSDECKMKLSANNCIILFPNELHKPGVYWNSKKTVKCVVKILKRE